jgi:hypothetical protein
MSGIIFGKIVEKKVNTAFEWHEWHEWTIFARSKKRKTKTVVIGFALLERHKICES